MAETITITDNRTGESIEIPIVERRRRRLRHGRKLAARRLVLRPGVHDHGRLRERDHRARRRRRHPALPRLPDRAARREVDLSRGRLPAGPRRAARRRSSTSAWEHEITYHTFIHENMRKRFMEGFHYDAHPMGMLVSAVAALSTFYPEAKDIDDPETRVEADRPAHRQDADDRRRAPPLQRRHAVRLPRQHARLLARTSSSMMWKVAEPRYEPIPMLVARARRAVHPARRPRAELLDHRDAGRRARAHADPYAALRAAAAALYGPRHGGANEAVIRMLTEIGSIDNVDAFVERVKAGQGPAAGLRSPRLQELRPAGHDHQADRRRGLRASRARTRCSTSRSSSKRSRSTDEYFISRKLYPNVDFYSGLIYQAMGFPIEMFPVLFAIPRTSGWLAHWVELLERTRRSPGPASSTSARRCATTSPRAQR